MNVSVAMAVYNGEQFLKDQILSIINQLRPNDELVISLDDSSDKSLEIIDSFIKSDNRIKLYYNPYSSGVVKNFQNAVEHCSGDVIFFSDQDDIWLEGKLQLVVNEFRDPYVSVVIHDAKQTDSMLNVLHDSVFSLRGGYRTTFWGNFLRLSYIGCCMAFRASYKNVVLPIPTIYRSHDWWTGCLLSVGKTHIQVIDKPLIFHRVHENNATPKHRPSFAYQLQVRWIILKNTILRYNKKLTIDKNLQL